MEVIKVKVIPRARKERVEIFQDGLKVYLAAPAVLGKANKRLIGILAEYYQIKKSDIVIFSGEKSRNKLIRIKNNK